MSVPTSARQLDLPPCIPRLTLLRFLPTLVALLAAPALSVAAVTVVRSDDAGVSFRYTPGQAAVTDGTGGRQLVEFGDADHLAEPGELDLPARVVRIGIPQTGEVRVSARPGPQRRLGAVRLATVPHVSWNGDSSWYDSVPADVVVLPAEPAAAGTPEVLRRNRFVAVRVSPCRYDTRTGELIAYEWLDVSVTFDRKPESNSESDPMDGAVSSMLLNGERALGWKLGWPSPPSPRFVSAASPAAEDQYERSPNWLKIRVDSTGIYGISGRELAAAGISLSGLNPATLAMYTIGEHEPNKTYPDTMRQVPISL